MLETHVPTSTLGKYVSFYVLFKHGMTALHNVCKSKGPAELVKLLIELGCDVMAKDNVSNDVMCAYMSYMISMMRSYVQMISTDIVILLSSADHDLHIMPL